MFAHWAFLGLCLIVVLCYLLRKNKSTSWLLKFPGPPPLPIIGNAAIFIGHPSDACEKVHLQFQKYGSTWTLWLFNQPTLMTSDPEVVKILTSSKAHLQRHFSYEYVMRMIFGQYGLISSSANQWLHDRKVLNKVFNPNVFENNLLLINNSSNLLCKIIELHGDKPLDLTSPLRHYFLNVLRNSLQVSQYLAKEVDVEIEAHLESMLESMEARIVKPWMRYDYLWKLSGYHNQLEKTHADMKRLFGFTDLVKVSDDGEKHNKPWLLTFNDGIKPMKSMSEILSNTNIPSQWKYDNLIGLVGAGTDTSVIVTTMTLFYLALNPECQRMAHEEVDYLFDERNNKPLLLADLSKLTYVKMCTKESMRLHPPVPLFGRTTTEDIILDDGRKIPSGAGVFVFIRDLHLNPKYFSNPEQFNPERFSTFNSALIKPYTYIPFGMGPRNCIGRKYSETVVIPTLAHILRNFSVSTNQTTTDIKSLLQVAGTPYPRVQLIFTKRVWKV